MNFKVYELLKLEDIQGFKDSLFEKIFYQCPDYLTAFKLIHYRKKSIESLKEIEFNNLRFQLISTFLKIELPFE